MIEDNGVFNQILVFCEGTTSNGTNIMSFKQGAFSAEKRIKPLLMKYSDSLVHPSYATMGIGPLAIFLLCWGNYKCEVSKLPDFEPNEYLFEKHADKAE